MTMLNGAGGPHAVPKTEHHKCNRLIRTAWHVHSTGLAVSSRWISHFSTSTRRQEVKGRKAGQQCSPPLRRPASAASCNTHRPQKRPTPEDIPTDHYSLCSSSSWRALGVMQRIPKKCRFLKVPQARYNKRTEMHRKPKDKTGRSYPENVQPTPSLKYGPNEPNPLKDV